MDSTSINNNKIKPKKRLGQNFLTEIGVIQKLTDAATILPGQTILEIGPGTGNLTAELVASGNNVIAVEKDREMIAILREKFATAPNLEIVDGDGLKFDESKIKPPYKIAANLPFYLAAPLIRKFLESQNPPLSLTVIVQKEVAQRIGAKPPHSNLLAIATQFYAAPKIIDFVSRGCFWPAPKVDCAILQITPHIYGGERINKEFVSKFFKIVKAGFSHPRKQLAGNLSAALNLGKAQTISWLAKNNLTPNQRAQTLSVENWIGLTQTFEL